MWTPKLTVAYDGTDYVGWQVQPNGISVQQKLEEAWQYVTGENVRITASGRTDAGVHALCQVCSCETDTHIEPANLARALDANTPESIAVVTVQKAATGFHAIHDAIGKTYEYYIQFGPRRSPLHSRHSWYLHQALDVAAMREAASLLQGKYDFASFEAAGSPRKTTERTITCCELTTHSVHGFNHLVIRISADGFLYNMARNIVGVLAEIGRGRAGPAWVSDVLQARDRSAAAITAPSRGLCLVDVQYPPEHLQAG